MAAKEENRTRTANRLAQESSPYLLQHAHNPVDWHPWGDEAFAKARAENKLVLVSIGYSSCHWCHVMERECFENDAIAAVMNAHYVCIKVDREERPDVDHVYMAAVQLLTGRGGWPLNCFTLPDGRPMHGGTYFPPAQWQQVLEGLHATWQREPERVVHHAEKLRLGIVASDVIEPVESDTPFDVRVLDQFVAALKPRFDRLYGGTDRAPKFPLPNELQFLLRQGLLGRDDELLDHVRLTLERMATGGIFDQLGGGFARYSTDVLWKVPHFEKMLYDNAQLVSLYSEAYQHEARPLYQRTVRRTLDFIAREMTAPDGLWYSALDADTEGVEGRYYIWQRQELEALLGMEFDLAAAYYSVNERGHWEHGEHILLRPADDAVFAAEFGISAEELGTRIAAIEGILLKARDQRTRPGLDDKCLTSWNALMVKAHCDAFAAFREQRWLQAAVTGMERALACCKRPDGGLWHSVKAGRATINGYLEDHSFMIEALLSLYQVSFDERWLQEARALAEHVIRHYHDPGTGLFHFTSDLDPPLITRHREVTDSVIPSSNSSLARSFFVLGLLFDDKRYSDLSDRMLTAMLARMLEHPMGHANWAQLLQFHAYPFAEIAITGPNAVELRAQFAPHFIPNSIFLGSRTTSDLPLLAGKPSADGQIFVCVDHACQLPVLTVEEAIRSLP